MDTREELIERIFSESLHEDFERTAMSVFHYQRINNTIYRKYLELLNRNKAEIKTLNEIPFLPVELFKTAQVVSAESPYDLTFSSSGTIGSTPALHFVKDKAVYEKSFSKGFSYFFGDVRDYCILALLPSYLEREGSSLVYMMDSLIKRSNHPLSGFYLNNHSELAEVLSKVQAEGRKTILLGVSFALIDFVESRRFEFPELIVMETGGMKGRKQELVREDLHRILCEGFGISRVHSEYGMTELLSQAYSKGGGIFSCPPWLQVRFRETNDPFSEVSIGKTGGINIIDLANIDSCSFIETQDLGKRLNDGSFEVLGRFENSDLRGCNLMVL